MYIASMDIETAFDVARPKSYHEFLSRTGSPKIDCSDPIARNKRSCRTRDLR